TLSIPSVLTINGEGTVLVPVNIDDPKPLGSAGMTAAQLALRYDPTHCEPARYPVRQRTVFRNRLESAISGGSGNRCNWHQPGEQNSYQQLNRRQLGTHRFP